MPLHRQLGVPLSVQVGESADGPTSGGAIRPLSSRRAQSRASPYPTGSRARLPPIETAVEVPPLTTGLSKVLGGIALQTPDGPISSRTRARRRGFPPPAEAASSSATDSAAAASARPPSPSPSKLRRLTAGASAAAAADPSAHAKYYSEEALRRRYSLMQHPVVAEALQNLWLAANTDASDQVLDKAEYCVMHRKLVLALDPSTPPPEAMVTAAEDWERDSEGHEEGLDRERFCWCWFELADLWTESMEPEEYEEFLTRTMDMITTTDRHGNVVWRDDKEARRPPPAARRQPPSAARRPPPPPRIPLSLPVPLETAFLGR